MDVDAGGVDRGVRRRPRDEGFLVRRADAADGDDCVVLAGEGAQRGDRVGDSAPLFRDGSRSRVDEVAAEMSDGEEFQNFAPFRRKRARASRRVSSFSARISAARTAAFFAPADPIATVATGIPAGIWTME